MGRIQSDIGLTTGIKIGQTVDALMALAARPRDALTQRTETLKAEQVAVTELAALLMAVRYVTDNLGKVDLYQRRSASSSNEASLSATITGQPANGVYQFTPVRTALAQQFLSAGLASANQPLGGGTLRLRYGDHVQRAAPLEFLGGGAGLRRGTIRITDRSGASAEIDLSAAQTIDDVLDAVNRSTAIGVTASAQGRHLVLTDYTGGAGRLRVQEVGSGTTAASLGLDGIDTAEASAAGRDILALSPDILLDMLNDGGGVQVSTVLPDISYTLRDGTSGEIDFSPLVSGASAPQKERTLGDILQVINAAAPGKLKAEIAPDGARLTVTDLTSGEGAFTFQATSFSSALAQLGLDGQAADGVITGRRLVGELKGVLLSSLNGGRGFGALGVIRLTDRSGGTATVDLSHAETLQDVLGAINAAGVRVSARVNDAKTGILLTDTSGASGRLIIADADETGTAAKLKLALDADRPSVDSGDLHLRTISHNMPLSALNGGAGISRGTFTITDSRGAVGRINLAQENAQTVGDLIRVINRSGAGVDARINETGDGILLVDLAHGAGILRVAEVNFTTAAELRLLGNGVQRTVDGVSTQVVDGSMTYTVELGANATLTDLQRKLSSLGAGVQAAIFSDGSARPFRLSLTSVRSGRAGQWVVDASGLSGLSLAESVAPRDAVLLMGAPASPSSVLLSSANNQFAGAVPGLSLQVKGASAPVSITVDSSSTDLTANLTAMVANYNRLRAALTKNTAYDAAHNQASVLTGDAAALRMDVDLSNLLTGRFQVTGSVKSLGELGISLKSDGTLEFDAEKFRAKYGADPDAVKDFFSHEKTGFAARFNEVAEQLTGRDVSLIAQRFKALDQKIKQNEERIEFMTKRLDSQRERLLLSFYRMETAISKLKSQMSALDIINQIAWPSTSNSSRSSNKSSS